MASTEKNEKLLRFQIYQLNIDPTFWSALYEEKLDHWKLDDSDKTCDARINENSVFLDRDSLHSKGEEQKRFTGLLKVFNTRHDLLDFHRKNGKRILQKTFSFIMLVHADLKQCTFDYFFAIPTCQITPPFVGVIQEVPAGEKSAVPMNDTIRLNALPDAYILPWITRNKILEYYQRGNKKFIFRSEKDKPVALTVRCPSSKFRIQYTGWSHPQVSTVNLAETMDPETIANQNAELNLKLMMWKHEPELPIDKLRNVRCLLLGAGTVGCNIARNLLAWGVRYITFVDSANVSHSNPVRQNLYTTEDFGEEKAFSAAGSLKRILPSVHAEGVTIDIPMPGHSHVGCEDDYKKIDSLIKNSDVIFLSTDTRESRWLPILIARRYSIPVINVALGYETLLVQYIQGGTGCYFCTDPVGPRDSLSSRTIDEKCTITRPGMAPIASAIAVEMFVEAIKDNRRTSWEAVRMNLSDMQITKQQTYRNEMCCCCSVGMIAELTEKGYLFVNEAQCDPDRLEDISGYKDLKELAIGEDDDVKSVNSFDE